LIFGKSLLPVGSGGGIDRSGHFFPPAPYLAARASNNKDKDEDGCIIVKEMWEKKRRGWQALIIAP
jgi:hypothetical protein